MLPRSRSPTPSRPRRSASSSSSAPTRSARSASSRPSPRPSAPRSSPARPSTRSSAASRMTSSSRVSRAIRSTLRSTSPTSSACACPAGGATLTSQHAGDAVQLPRLVQGQGSGRQGCLHEDHRPASDRLDVQALGRLGRQESEPGQDHRQRPASRLLARHALPTARQYRALPGLRRAVLGALVDVRARASVAPVAGLTCADLLLRLDTVGPHHPDGQCAQRDVAEQDEAVVREVGRRTQTTSRRPRADDRPAAQSGVLVT